MSGDVQKENTMRILPLLLIAACGAENAAPPAVHLPSNQWRVGTPRLLSAAGPHVDAKKWPVSEVGSAWAVDHAGAFCVRRGTHSSTPGGGLERIPHCAGGGPIYWARADTVGMPSAWKESFGGCFPAGKRYLHIRMDADLCLAAWRHKTDVPIRRSWWVPVNGGPPEPMWKGGGSPCKNQDSACGVSKLKVETRSPMPRVRIPKKKAGWR